MELASKIQNRLYVEDYCILASSFYTTVIRNEIVTGITRSQFSMCFKKRSQLLKYCDILTLHIWLIHLVFH